MQKNLLNIVDLFTKKNILVIGDLILDRFSIGEVERVNPEQPAAHLVKITKEKYVLGGAANVANNLSSLGAHCTLYGLLGNDGPSKMIMKLCRSNKIKLKYFNSNSKTIVKQRVIAHSQQITRMDFGEKKLRKITNSTKEKIINQLKRDIKFYDFIILSDYDKALFTEELTREIISLARDFNIRILADPKPQNIDFFKGVFLISPNKSEAEKITKIKYEPKQEILEKIGENLCKRINSRYVIITCSEDGVFVYDNESKKSSLIKTQAKEVSDVTGAGDTFAATLVLALASGLEIYDSVKLANHAAGIVVGKVGTATISLNELQKSLNQNP
ncbi:bifunctional heptose 7-phosphate kinase/heptose 1-phosphate adenyltransferase [Nanoarchaeota archaeon]